MKVGIVVYSQTGNTHTVAQKLKEKFIAAGHSAEVEQVTVTGNTSPGSKDFQLVTIPNTSSYDALVFAAPVQAFSLSPVMAAYLKQIQSLQDKKIACYVTKQLPRKWTGGNQAIGKIKRICESKGGTVCGSEIINWNSNREQIIDECVDNLVCLF